MMIRLVEFYIGIVFLMTVLAAIQYAFVDRSGKALGLGLLTAIGWPVALLLDVIRFARKSEDNASGN